MKTPKRVYDLVVTFAFWIEIAILILVSLGLGVSCRMGWTSSSPTEIFGFVTGGMCVWLGVRQSVWTWPIGLANNVAFFVLFWRERLFADAFIQVVFFSLGVYGWWNWLSSKVHPRGPAVQRTKRGEWLVLLAISPLAIWGLRELLVVARGASPMWDSLTAVLSLAAQFLMSRKRLENWLIWIVADVIYVPLYLSRSLPLTAVLYFVFMMMCVMGWFRWRESMLAKTGDV